MKTVNQQHVIVYDPIPFHGGSKVATLHAMEQADENIHFHVISSHPDSWTLKETIVNVNLSISVSQLPLPQSLARHTQGALYWLKQCYLLMMLVIFTLALCTRYWQLPSKIILASGPGVDLAGYLLAFVIRLPAVQLVHGPVGKSRASNWCLSQGHPTFYLEAAKPSLLTTLATPFAELPKHFHRFVNGIPRSQWPTDRHENKEWHHPTVFWAASLLKWKGLDLLVNSLQRHELSQHLHSTICYIKPEKTSAEVCQAPVALENSHWHRSPSQLDELRAASDIYVSTSQYEPFGLSTLEALAAGLIVVIPADGAYWDHKLQHGFTCFKYRQNDADSLNQILEHICRNLSSCQKVGKNGQKIANQYKASDTYRDIAQAMQGNVTNHRSHKLGEL
ncbi:glycosyltransferase family 4 protein [Vibrio astriarenae]